jgi:hypothetical protein
MGAEGKTANLGLTISGHGADGHDTTGTSQFDLDLNMEILDAAVGTGVTIPTVVNVTGNYTASAGQIVLCDTSGGDFSVTLPLSAANKGKPITVKKKSTDSNVLTVAASGSDSLDTFGSTVSTNQPGTSLDFAADGVTTWELV